MRLLVDDKPGVLGKIATTFGDAEVSLKSCMQSEFAPEGQAEIIMVTHRVKHKNILQAQENLKNLSVVDEILNVIRVE